MREMGKSLIWLLVISSLVQTIRTEEDEVNEDQKKLDSIHGKRKGKFGIFQIVTFPNVPCPTGENNRQGICYDTGKCIAKGGAIGASCANAMGVCCLFQRGCGTRSAENCTYFTPSASDMESLSGSSCSLKICKCSNEVCQLRLDFEEFVISGPSTSTDSVGATIFGTPTGTTAMGNTVTQASQCLTDSFTVSNPGNAKIGAICGQNSGEHMYIDACPLCNDLTFNFGSVAKGTNIGTRSWTIKVTQLDCRHPDLAPDGCTQYFTANNGAGNIQTYNYAGGQHLSEQNQVMCIRRERGFCRICYWAEQVTDFAVSGTATSQGLVTCGGYGSSGMKASGADWVSFPGAQKKSTTSMGATKMVPGFSRICGNNKGLVTTKSGEPATICTTRTPFIVTFRSDACEFGMMEQSVDTTGNRGFRLFYEQDNNCD